MVKEIAICERVINSNTFITADDVKIQLTRVKSLPLETIEGSKAKMLLESFISGNIVDFEVISIDRYGDRTAEVWVRGKNINEAMLRAGY
jgi:endonuclease YncB( thermonuclease family)